jgi:tetratricopeptide (TPR) repeat protein
MNRRTLALAAAWTLVPALLVLAGCDRTAPGRAAWRAGRPAEALAEFRRAAVAADERASPELLHDLAVAALQAGDLDEALEAAGRAAARGGPPFEAYQDFVRASVSFARSIEAETAAAAPGADTSLLERAAAHAEDALARWRLAAASRSDWPEARRNVERALLRIERLRERRREGGASPTAPPPPRPPPPAPPPPVPTEATPKEDGVTVERGLLPAEEVRRLFDLLLEKERAKQAVRREARTVPPAGGGKDW